MLRSLAIFLAAGVLLLAPYSASAATVNFFGPIVPAECNCEAGSSDNGTPVPSAPEWGCVLATLQNLVVFAISIGVLIVTLMMAYAGILWIASPFNPHNREEGRSLLINSVIGLVITLTSWLIVDFVMKFFYNDQKADAISKGLEESSSYLPWESILGGNQGAKCLKVTNLPDSLGEGGSVGEAGGYLGNGRGGGWQAQPAIETQPATATESLGDRIYNAAMSFKGKSTTACNCAGNACAWAVNQVLRNARIAAIGSTQVVGMEQQLRGGRGNRITKQSDTKRGDIVIVTNAQTSGGRSANHVGICLNNGCTQTISNSSSDRAFTWVGDPFFSASYKNADPKFYRVIN